MSNSYRDLKVWKRSIDLAETIYRLTASFPACEMYGLSSQMRRAAVSVASNIAEGWGRRSRKEYGRFVLVERGSNDELQTQLVIAERLGFCKPQEFAEANALSDEIGKMLSGLHRFLETPRRNPLEPSTSNLVHHTRQAFTGIIGCPTLQPNALPNSGKFCTEPLMRHSPELCGSVFASTRALASRVFSHQTWPKAMK